MAEIISRCHKDHLNAELDMGYWLRSVDPCHEYAQQYGVVGGISTRPYADSTIISRYCFMDKGIVVGFTV